MWLLSVGGNSARRGTEDLSNHLEVLFVVGVQAEQCSVTIVVHNGTTELPE